MCSNQYILLYFAHWNKNNNNKVLFPVFWYFFDNADTLVN